jgi:DNA polymerase-1
MLTCYNSFVAFYAQDTIINKLKSMDMYDLYRNVELPLVYSLDSMEKTGVKIDHVSLKQYGETLKTGIDELEKDIYSECGMEFNINSPKQLGEVLFEKLGIEGGKKTKTGYSTSADVLEKLKVDYPVVSKILEYRQLTKLKSTYADGLINYVDNDGRIRGKFNQTITATGRISSTEPNLQNIPIRTALGSMIRKVFVPKEGCVFVDADYSQIELRILAHMSEDESLIEAYNSGKDIHKITASKVFGVPLDEVTKEQRSNAKAVNFGIVYGMSSFGLSQDLSISRKEAAEYINQYFETYPKVKEYLDRQVESAKNNGYITTLFGRRRPIPELKSSNFMQRAFGERIAMNSPIQGSAADIMKIAMINVENRLKNEGLMSKIVLQVHDELLVEAYENEVEIVKNIVFEEMTNAAKLSVILDVDVQIGKNWLEAH